MSPRLLGRRFRMPETRRRILDVEIARFRRGDALDAFDLAATRLVLLRRLPDPDPVEVVAAEARFETARVHFWAADNDYRVARNLDAEVETG